ncbi:MAG TPA: glycosyltransferase [Legionellaceae bacterium]|nr:glycosyltransferase [Legionellaceae bacterium]
MKILHVYKTFINDTMGGTEQVIAQLASAATPEMQHTVLSLTKQTPGSLEGLYRIKNIRYKEQINIASNSMSLGMLRDFPEIVKDYDLIHYHFPWPFADLLHVLWQIKKPSIVTYHSDVIRQKLWLRLYQPLMHRFLNTVQAIVATSPQYLMSSTVLQQYRDKAFVVPIGIDRSHYPNLSKERLRHWRERFGERFFLFVGVMRYYKGLSVLLEAMQHTEYPLLIVGQGPCEQELKAQAQRLNLTHVHFLGNISEEDKIALLHLCLAFVFPSILRSEAFGVSLLEAAMLGKPMISTELGTGTSYINLDKTTGIVVPSTDVLALRNALNYLWSHPELAQAMGKEAALRHQSLFTAQQMIEGYEAIYRRL